MNIFLAIYEEHKQRTGHDIYNQKKFSNLSFTCNVCLYLSAEKHRIERKQNESYVPGN